MASRPATGRTVSSIAMGCRILALLQEVSETPSPFTASAAVASTSSASQVHRKDALCQYFVSFLADTNY